MTGRRRRAGTLTASLGAAGALLLGLCAPGASAAPAPHRGHAARSAIVDTADGPVRGLWTRSGAEFLGVPYAAPPVRALRWQPPQPPTRWHGVRDATRYAPHCAQLPSPFGVASQSEDCLYLNVFTPAAHHDPRRELPVMVWIHGGALVTGESQDVDPTQLVRDGVIVVTINYRLGALGFLATSSLAAEQDGHAGDYGLMDQQAALRWVQRNIGRFGGDRSNVTIFGESAGGLSVLSQLASPGARGLFAKAIVESGAYSRVQATLDQAEASGRSFAAAVGCADQSTACLRAMPVSTILAHESAGGYQPIVDGRVLTQQLAAAFARGQFNRVPVIDGSNHDEWRLLVALDNILGNHPITAQNYPDQFGVPPAIAAEIVAEYPLSDYASPSLAVGAVGTDATYACPALATDGLLSRYVPTYAYEFNDAPEVYLPPINGFPYGSAHASELQYLFHLTAVAYPSPLTAAQQRLAATMRAYWTNFAKHGFPTGLGTPWWPRFGSAGARVQSLAPPGPRTETDFAAEHKCGFWSALTG